MITLHELTRTFNPSQGNTYTALKDINLIVNSEEFLVLIGHSGCGKSTIINMIAGFDTPSEGVVLLDGQKITGPGPDRMVVFQHHALLPWLTVKGNIALVVNQVLKRLPKTERQTIIEEAIDQVGLREAANRKPKQLSGGMKQRVAIARALAVRPRLLLLDEPFGALDALTRSNLQQQLIHICEQNKITCIMVTHDVDEGLLLADRIALMTNGPDAKISQILNIPFSHPRERLSIINHPYYYGLRSEIVNFLNQQKRHKIYLNAAHTKISRHGLEKVNLDLGYIPLVDLAPLVVAKEKGLFQKYGLDEVNFIRQPSWKVMTEEITNGELDAAPLIGGLPLAITIGTSDIPSVPLISALTLSRNGNAILLSRELWDQGVRSGEAFKKIIAQKEKNYKLGVVHQFSIQNITLRHWLANAGINPDQDVELLIIPPANMVSNLKNGTIDGCCAANPWLAQAFYENIAQTVATTLDIWPGQLDKVLAVREDWAQQHPKTHLALIKALAEACQYCDDLQYRPQILEWLCRPEYLGTELIYTHFGFTDNYPLDYSQDGIEPDNFIYYHRHNSCFPDRNQSSWILAQLCRWKMLDFPNNWPEILDRIYRIDLFNEAMELTSETSEKIIKNSSLKHSKFYQDLGFDSENILSYLQQS
jgi:nitrate/nitrite transport system ATP-binding protein